MRQELNESWLRIHAQVESLRKAGTEPTNNVDKEWCSTEQVEELLRLQGLCGTTRWRKVLATRLQNAVLVINHWKTVYQHALFSPVVVTRASELSTSHQYQRKSATSCH